MSFKKFYNILYYNIFRFHYFVISRFRQLIGLDGVLLSVTGSEPRDGHSVKEILNSQRGRDALFITGRITGMIEAALIITIWTLLCALLNLNIYSWKYGMIFVAVVGAVEAFVFDHADTRDFEKFGSWPIDKKRKFAIITLLVVCGICVAFVGSLVLYLSE